MDHAAHRPRGTSGGSNMGTTAPVHQLSIAVADPQAVLRESLAAYLSTREGIRVVGTSSSVRGLLDLVEATQPEVLVADADLFGEGGIEAISSLMARPKPPRVVILMTGGDRERAASAMRMGVSACVLKEAPLDDLLSAIHAVAEGQMWMSPPLLTAMFSEYRTNVEQLRAREELKRLTQRELEVLRLMVSGYSRAAIAEALHVANDTVRTHTQNLERKLNVHSAVAAVAIARQAGMRPTDEVSSEAAVGRPTAPSSQSRGQRKR